MTIYPDTHRKALRLQAPHLFSAYHHFAKLRGGWRFNTRDGTPFSGEGDSRRRSRSPLCNIVNICEFQDEESGPQANTLSPILATNLDIMVAETSAESGSYLPNIIRPQPRFSSRPSVRTLLRQDMEMEEVLKRTRDRMKRAANSLADRKRLLEKEVKASKRRQQEKVAEAMESERQAEAFAEKLALLDPETVTAEEREAWLEEAREVVDTMSTKKRVMQEDLEAERQEMEAHEKEFEAMHRKEQEVMRKELRRVQRGWARLRRPPEKMEE